MKTTVLSVLVIAFAAGTTSLAQDMVEYSHIAAKPPVGLQGLANKINGSLQKSATQGSSGAQVQTIESTKSGAAPESVAKPTPPALFILSDGKQLESSHYVLTSQSLVDPGWTEAADHPPERTQSPGDGRRQPEAGY